MYLDVRSRVRERLWDERIRGGWEDRMLRVVDPLVPVMPLMIHRGMQATEWGPATSKDSTWCGGMDRRVIVVSGRQLNVEPL